MTLYSSLQYNTRIHVDIQSLARHICVSVRLNTTSYVFAITSVHSIMLCRLFEQLYLPNNNRSKTSRSFCISGKTLSPTYPIYLAAIHLQIYNTKFLINMYMEFKSCIRVLGTHCQSLSYFPCLFSLASRDFERLWFRTFLSPFKVL